MKSCDNCKYEPDWGPVRGNDEFRTMVGKCKKKVEIQDLPACYNSPIQHSVVKYEEDGSGVHINCKTWEAKGE